MIRRALSLLIAVYMPAVSFAAVNRSDPAKMMVLVDQYIQEVTATPKQASVYYGVGQQAWITKAVATQITTLEPEDFNVFLLYLMDRYIQNPQERKALFGLISTLRENIAADLENTRQLEDGPAHYVISGTYSTITWVLLGGGLLAWRGIMASPMRSHALVQRLQSVELAAAKARPLYRIPYRVASNPAVWSMLAGGGIGYLEYILEKNRTHKIDPVAITNIVQAQLACALSYQALTLDERAEKARQDENLLRDEYPKLKAEIASVLDQAGVLLEQFDRLDNLDVKDRLFQKELARLPQAKTFQELRKNLSEAETSQDGQCRQMSLTHLRVQLGKTLENLVILKEALIGPDEPSAPPVENKP